MRPSTHEIEDLARDYLLSNTPAYLFKRFRSHESVQRMARNLPSPQLVRMYEDNRQQNEKALMDVVLAYAALIALSLADDPSAHTALRQLNAEGLDFAADLIEIGDSARKTTSLLTLQMHNRAPESVSLGGQTSATNEIEIGSRRDAFRGRND